MDQHRFLHLLVLEAPTVQKQFYKSSTMETDMSSVCKINCLVILSESTLIHKVILLVIGIIFLFNSSFVLATELDRKKETS